MEVVKLAARQKQVLVETASSSLNKGKRNLSFHSKPGVISFFDDTWVIRFRSNMLVEDVVAERLDLLGRDDGNSDRGRLVVHEIDTHVLRAANGYCQPYRIFAVGAVPSYLMTEEGLAVVNEERMGYSDHPRTRLFAARVLAAMSALTQSFSVVYAELRDRGFSHGEAFVITRRVKRGLTDTSMPGGYIKDHAYLWGRVQVEEYVLGGGDLSRLYVGKIALEHVPFVEDLGLAPPRYLPYPYS